MSLNLLSGTHNLVLGQSFNKKSQDRVHTIRYDFKPASLDSSKPAKVEVSKNNEVSVRVPHIDSTKQTVYRGSKKPSAGKECVLIIDHKTREFRLEKVTSAIHVKKTRETVSTPKETAYTLDDTQANRAQVVTGHISATSERPQTPDNTNTSGAITTGTNSENAVVKTKSAAAQRLLKNTVDKPSKLDMFMSTENKPAGASNSGISAARKRPKAASKPSKQMAKIKRQVAAQTKMLSASSSATTVKPETSATSEQSNDQEHVLAKQAVTGKKETAGSVASAVKAQSSVLEKDEKQTKKSGKKVRSKSSSSDSSGLSSLSSSSSSSSDSDSESSSDSTKRASSRKKKVISSSEVTRSGVSSEKPKQQTSHAAVESVTPAVPPSVPSAPTAFAALTEDLQLSESSSSDSEFESASGSNSG